MAEIGKHVWFPGPEKCPIPKHRIQVRLGVCAEQGDLDLILLINAGRLRK